MLRNRTTILIVAICLLIAGCGTSSEEATPVPAAEGAGAEVMQEATAEAEQEAGQDVEEEGEAEPEDETMSSEEADGVIDPTLFDSAGLVSEPQIVDCTLQDGSEDQCVEFVTKYLPDDLVIGPFCPENIYEDEGGIWEWDGENPGVYRLNEAFFTMLSDQGYEFYDTDGNVYIGDPAGGIQAGVNNCLEATADETVEMTVRIPLRPVLAESPTSLGTVAQVGLGIDAVPIFADAPSVLQTGHLPPLDVCGGHIDPGGWYHWHATASDIHSSFEHEGVDAECHLEQSGDALFGYAFDGYPIYGSIDMDGTMPTNLDECSGHTAPTAEYPSGVYHYHAGLEFPNLPTCLVGVSANNAFATTGSAGIGAGGGPGGGGPGGRGGPPPEDDAQAPADDDADEAESMEIDEGLLFTIPGENVFPEGVSYDQATGKFYVGSTSDGTLYVGDINGELEMTVFSEGGADGRTAAIGTKVDSEGLLWVAGGGTGQVFVYDTADGAHVATITTPAADATFINDLAITESGVYFTDSFRSILWRVTDPAQGEAEAWLDFTGTALTYVEGFNLNGIVATEDGGTLIVVHTGEGQLYRIDVASQNVAPIDTGATSLTAGDGLALVDNTIYVTRNSVGEIVSLELSDDLSSGTGGMAITSELFSFPTTIAFTGNSFLVANSQFNNRGGTPDLPFTVAQIPLEQVE